MANQGDLGAATQLILQKNSFFMAQLSRENIAF
jgi:hypothetical protein